MAVAKKFFEVTYRLRESTGDRWYETVSDYTFQRAALQAASRHQTKTGSYPTGTLLVSSVNTGETRIFRIGARGGLILGRTTYEGAASSKIAREKYGQALSTRE